MRTIITAVLALAVTFAVPNAFAGCPTITGPHAVGGAEWFQYDFDTNCASTSGNVSSTTLSCYSTPAYSFNYQSGGPFGGTVSYSFTADVTSSVWEADIFYDFDDPNVNWYNYLLATVTVTHNGSSSQYYIVIHHGTNGSASCDRPYVNFSAQSGDTITIDITGSNYYSNTSMKASAPTLFRY